MRAHFLDIMPNAGRCLLLVCLLSAGCSRAFWRKQADRDSYNVIAEKMTDPRWVLPRVDVTPDVRSRFFDPYDLDKPPLPPDDPAAHEYLHNVAGMKGYKSWHKLGDTLTVENPQWLEPFPLLPRRLETYGADKENDDAENGGYGDSPKPDTKPGDAPSPEKPKENGPALPNDVSFGVDLPPPAPPATLPGESAESADNSSQADELSSSETGDLVPTIENLTLDQAIELANIHSREYQREIEDLYLSSLDLTFDRFQFNVRYLGVGGREPSGDLEFGSIPGGENSLGLTNRFGISKLLPTGGQLAVELANNTLWLFAGSNRSTTASVLSYSLVQPLLIGAGRKIVLEDLTQGERNVLYATRDLARFRKQFFTDTVAGGRSNGFLGLLQQRQVITNQELNIELLKRQLTILRILASQRPPEISEDLVALPAGLALAVAPGIKIAPVLVGKLRYLNMKLFWAGDMTDEQEQAMRSLSNDAAFLKAANELVQRVRTEVVTLDVAQLETRFANSRQALAGSKRRYSGTLDNFKVQLGLPPGLQLTIDESMLRPFELIDGKLRATQADLEQFVDEWAQLDGDDFDFERFQSVVQGLNEQHDAVEDQGIALLRTDFERVEQAMPDRLSRLSMEVERKRVRLNFDRDRRLFESILQDLADVDLQRQPLDQAVMKKSLEDYLDSLDSNNNGKLEEAEFPASWRHDFRRLDVEQDGKKDNAIDATELAKAFVVKTAEAREQLLRIAMNLQVVQIGLRTELIRLARFELTMKESVGLGMENRLDLKNAAAAVMDDRRQVEVRANQLEALIDVRAEGDVRTPTGKRPFDFRGARSSFRAGVAFTAPLDLISERNAYRVSLINYQRSRRDYMAFEDNVKLEIRQEWRDLTVLQNNFETAREAVRYAALQYDQAVEQTIAPATSGPSRSGGDQGLKLLNALNSVLTAQNNLIGIWENFERNRLNIYRDMGIMEIDAGGVWVDPVYLHPREEEEPDNEERTIENGADVVVGVIDSRDQSGVQRRSRSPQERSPLGRTGPIRQVGFETPERPSAKRSWYTGQRFRLPTRTQTSSGLDSGGAGDRRGGNRLGRERPRPAR
jgi:outer membrane protein TolC